MHVIFQFTFYADLPSSMIANQFSGLQGCFKHFQPLFRFHHSHLQLKMLLAEAAARRWHVLGRGEMPLYVIQRTAICWEKSCLGMAVNENQFTVTTVYIILSCLYYFLYPLH